jgi:hypothetical protein
LRNLVAVAVLGSCATVVIVVAGAAILGAPTPEKTARPSRTYQDVFSPAGMAKMCVGCSLTALPGGQVLLAGGYVQDSAPTATEQLWDPQSGSWTPTGSLDERRTQHAAVLLETGKVLVAGGTGLDATGKSLQNLTSSELYDPQNGTWSPTGSLSKPLGSTATLLGDGTVLMTGSGMSELYDPSTGRWTPGGSLVAARSGASQTLLANGTVLVAGGVASTSAGMVSLSSAEIYDPRTRAWTPTGSMLSTRAGQSATRLADGRVLVTGDRLGIKSSAGLPTDPTLAEVFDPKTGTWTAAGQMPLKGSANIAALLDDGRVLVPGLTPDAGSRTTTFQVFDPTTGSWAQVGAPQPFTPMAMTLLSDGSVLIVGPSRTADGGTGGYATVFR